MHQCVPASSPGAVLENNGGVWEPVNISGAMRLLSASQVHPAAMLGTEIMPGPHFKRGYRKGHQIQDRPGALTPHLPQSPCCDANQTFTGI